MTKKPVPHRLHWLFLGDMGKYYAGVCASGGASSIASNASESIPNSLTLRISPSATGWQVSGQVLGAELGAGVAHLAGAKTECQAAIDPMSTFALPAAPSGHYTLTLSWPALAIAVDDLVLGDA